MITTGKLINIEGTPLYIDKDTYVRSLYNYFGDLVKNHSYINHLFIRDDKVMLEGDDYYGEEDSLITDDPKLVNLFKAIKTLQECI